MYAQTGVKMKAKSFGYAVCDLVKCKWTDIKDCVVPVSACTAEMIFNTLHLTGSFPHSYNVASPLNSKPLKTNFI